MNIDKYNIIAKIQQGEGLDQQGEDILKPFIEKYMLPYVPPKKYPSLLDIGSGFGYEPRSFTNYGWNVTAIDHSDSNIKHAKEKYGINTLKMDMHDLQFAPGTFNVAVTHQVFEHSFAPWILAMEIWVVLKKAGRWIIDLPSPQNKEMWSLWHPNMLYSKQIRFLLLKTGFDVIHADEEGGKTYDYNEGGEPYTYIVEKADGYPDNYKHILQELETYHKQNNIPFSAEGQKFFTKK